jgi:hypothetical protein
MTAEPTSKDKQITIEVPEDRVAEFYAFYGRFLAGRGQRGRGRGRHCGHHRGHHRADEARTPDVAGAADAGTQTA